MSHGDPEAAPHLWLIGPNGWLCVVGAHDYASTAAPYGSCPTAMPYATAAIDRAEDESGLSIVAIAGQLGVQL